MVKNKRSFFAVILAFVMIIALTACGSSGKTESDGTNDRTVSVQSETENDSEITSESEKTATEPQDGSKESDSPDINTEDTNKILVVYFSWSGHLDSMAHWVADETGGDLYCPERTHGMRVPELHPDVASSGIALECDARCDAKRQRQGKNNRLDTASWCDRHSGIRRICAHPEADWRVSVFTDTFSVLRPYGTDHLFLHGLYGDYGTVRFLRTLSWKSIKVV